MGIDRYYWKGYEVKGFEYDEGAEVLTLYTDADKTIVDLSYAGSPVQLETFTDEEINEHLLETYEEYVHVREEEFPFVVSVLDDQNNPSDNLDSFVLLEDAIDFAKHNSGSAVFKETCNTEKNTCDYELVWRHTGPTYEIVRFHRDFDKGSQVIRRGLTLEEAQAHCSNDDTTGDGWFDGYQKEEE